MPHRASWRDWFLRSVTCETLAVWMGFILFFLFLDCPWYTAALKQKCSAIVLTGYLYLYNVKHTVSKGLQGFFIGGGSLRDGSWTTTSTVLHIHQQVLSVVPSKWSSSSAGIIPWKCSYRNDALSLFKYSKVKCVKQLICGTFQEEYPHKGHEDGPEEGGSTGDCLKMWVWFFKKRRKVSLFYTKERLRMSLNQTHIKQASVFFQELSEGLQIIP